MNKQQQITSWLMQCPQLQQLYNISAEEMDGANIIFPVGSSQRQKITDGIDITGCYEADIVPFASVYEEYQINCYKDIQSNQNDYNVMKLEEVENAIDWINTQNDLRNFPIINDLKIVSVETFPFVPQIRGVDRESGTVCYYITLRITYVNTLQRRSVEWQM